MKRTINILLVGIASLVLGWFLRDTLPLARTGKHVVTEKDSDNDYKTEVSIKTKGKYSNNSYALFNSPLSQVSSVDSQLQVRLKFEPYFVYNDFIVRKIYKGPKARINFSDNFFSGNVEPTYSAMKEPNFAGHYAFVELNCDSFCHGFAIVDFIDGKVYSGVAAYRGYDYRENSRMVIVDPPYANSFFEDLQGHRPSIIIWDEEWKEFLDKEAREATTN